MWQMRWMAISAALAVAISGCGKSAGTDGSSSAPVEKNTVSTNAQTGDHAQLDGPAAATQEFLEALRTGNDEKATQMLSKKAREKTASLNQSVKPSASDTASFSIGKIDYVNDDGARVACTWTDLDGDGEPQTDKVIWVLRREQEGWRVVGVAFQIFPGEEPLSLNFEDPDDMSRKKQWAREETRRRMEADDLQAQGKEKQENPIRR
jgi:hypothetical protein